MQQIECITNVLFHGSVCDYLMTIQCETKCYPRVKTCRLGLFDTHKPVDPNCSVSIIIPNEHNRYVYLLKPGTKKDGY